MNLDYLRAFEQAAVSGSLTRAAVSLNIAQPSVSRMIGELESEWQCELFHRTGRGVVLTEDGILALRRTQGLLRELDALSQDMKSLSGAPRGDVVLALPSSLSKQLLPTLVNALLRERPGIRLRIHEGFSEQIQRWLADETVQIALYSDYTSGSLENKNLTRDTFVVSSSRVVLASRSIDDLQNASIEFHRLDDYPLVLQESKNGLRALVESLARQRAIKLNIVAEAGSLSTQEILVLECGLYMLRGERAVPRAKDAGKFRELRIENPSIHRRIVLATAPQSRLSRAARDVIAYTQTILRDLR